MGDVQKFKEAVDYISNNVSFDHCSTVQVFEATIRCVRCLLVINTIVVLPIKTCMRFFPLLLLLLIITIITTTIISRVMGSLLSAHLIITDPDKRLGDFTPTQYNDELLYIAHDLAARLIPAFDDTVTGVPHPRVSE